MDQRHQSSPAPSSATPPTAGRFSRAAGLGHRYPLLRRAGMLVVDALVLTFAFFVAYQFRFDFQLLRPANAEYFRQFLHIVPFVVLIRLAMLVKLGLYRGFTRYTGLYELINILFACLVGSLALLAFNLVHTSIPSLGPNYPLAFTGEHVLRIPIGILNSEWVLAVMGIGGVRLARRLLGEKLIDFRSEDRKRVLVVGAGDAGEQVARTMLRTFRDRFRPVSFVDPDPALEGHRIHGIPVDGTLEDIDEVVRRRSVEMVVIALPSPTPALLRSLIDKFQRARLEFKIIPNLDAVMEGRIEINRLRPVEIEDLLGREAVNVEADAERSCLRGKRVLVTGAGGSIGGELSRQALEHRPSELILLGRGENSIYEIQLELSHRARELGVAMHAFIGNIRDPNLVDGLFERAKPEIVLHAAAHKHVHFMEAQPAEAVKNNVLGTRLLAEAAIRTGVERFILISTDKAVRPTGVMGASKRVAEMIVSALNQEGVTRFISVRFGNVLGSRGSVIPLFKRQIAAGGPVTITHAEVTRYFMTIPEAASLVIAAGTQGQGGEVFLLDMGEPVKIADLARQLIVLSGLEPGRDIPIVFTGLRPGEKLYEELLTAEENRQPTAHPKIFSSLLHPMSWGVIGPGIEQLEALALTPDADPHAIRAMLGRLIPDYQGGAHAPHAAKKSDAIGVDSGAGRK